MIRRADHTTPFYPQKLALNFVESSGRSVGIFHLRTKGQGVCLSSGIRRHVFLEKADDLEEHIASNFRANESPWFAARLYITTDWEESLLQVYLHCRVYLLPWRCS
jgi:hypothetical protein